MSFLARKISALKELIYFSNWPILIIGRLPIFNNRFGLYQKGPISFITDYKGGDATGARHLLASGLYKGFIDTIVSRSGSLRNVLDIGANNGGFILYLTHTLAEPLSKIVGLEFNYRTYLRLHFNVLYNTNKNTDVKLINAAASGENGLLNVDDNFGSTGNSIYASQISNSKVLIPTLTFDTLYQDNFNSEQIDLCKIDIEGAEYEFLNLDSSKELINIKYLLIEIHPNKEQNSKQLIDNITSRGFDLLISGNEISPDVFLFERKYFK